MWRSSEKWFSAGLLVGALFTGLVLVLPLDLLSAWLLPVPVRAAAFVAVATCVVLDVTGLRRFAFPQNARQVPQAIAHGEPAIGALRFGVEMGTGLRTFSPSGLPHLLVAGLFLVGSGGMILPAAVGFAIGRAVMARGAVRAPQAWVTGWDDTKAVVSWLGLGLVLVPLLPWALA